MCIVIARILTGKTKYLLIRIYEYVPILRVVISAYKEVEAYNEMIHNTITLIHHI